MAVAQGELLERESELAVLAEALTAVTAASAGALAMVHGEAGVGKTALLHRFCQERARWDYGVSLGRMRVSLYPAAPRPLP